MQRNRASGRECGPNAPGIFHTLVRLVVASDHVAVLLAPRVNLEKEWEQLSLGMKKRKKKHRNKEIPYGEQLAKTSPCAHRQLDVPGQRNEAEPLGNDIKLTRFLLFCSIYPSPNSSDRTEPGRGAQVPPLCGCFAALGGTA